MCTTCNAPVSFVFDASLSTVVLWHFAPPPAPPCPKLRKLMRERMWWVRANLIGPGNTHDRRDLQGLIVR